MFRILNKPARSQASDRSQRSRPRGSEPWEVFGEPSLARPTSQACTESQFYEPAYAYWCEQFKEHPRTHRKQWEFCYILQALSVRGKLSPQVRGLGFGVGEEPLTALFAARGVEVTATDLGAVAAADAGWVCTGQHARILEDLNRREICPPDPFASRVRFETIDMQAIPASLRDFDFTWSACALEHLGSITNGQDFILESLQTLRAGGVAVHTTEFNVNDEGDTLDHTSTVLFRRRDLETVLRKARGLGYRCSANWSTGSGQMDAHVDLPPYSGDQHLKLRVESYVTTSIGLIFDKPEDGSSRF